MASARQGLLRNEGHDSDSGTEDDVHANLLCPHPLSVAMSAACCFLPMVCSCTVMNQKEDAAVMYWGKYIGTIQGPGIFCLNPCGLDLRKVSTQVCSLDIKDLKCTDGRGSPIIVSGNVIYRIRSAKRAAVDVKDVFSYVMEQAPMVLRKVCTRYPYDNPSGPSLRGGHDGHPVGEDLRKVLHEAVHDAGVEVLKFDLTDLSYAPEIAMAMLQRQQAEAMIEARQLVVASAVDMAHSAVSRMKQLGHPITPQGEEKLFTNLLTVIVGDRGVQPTIHT